MGFFSNIFRQRQEAAAGDYSALAADMHSHLIPGIDDGAPDMETSLQLISGLRSLGFRKLITTPHVMSDHFKNTPEIISSGLEALRQAVKQEGIDVELEAAAEYYVDHDFDRRIGSGGLMTFGNRHVLIEVSFLNPVENLNDIVFRLVSNGFRPVMAHVERYPYWYGSFDHYSRLKDMGLLLQMNINSLTGHYSVPTKRMAERLLQSDLIDLLGTDCHHTGHLALLKKALGNRHLQKALSSGRILNASLFL